MPSAQHKAADFDSQTRFCPKVVLTQPGSSANDTIKTHSTTSQGDFDRLNVTKSAQCRTPGHLNGGMAVIILDGKDEWPYVPKEYKN